MIPKTQFTVFIVTSENTGIIMGVYQTYKQAYERIVELAMGSRLQEYPCISDHVGYMFERNGQLSKYSIQNSLFTYDKNEPLISDYFTRLEAICKQEAGKSTVINT